LTFGRVSPDGQWIVFISLEPQEDLFLVRPDGSGLRQLTKDPFKDRGPGWSPDGKVVFFSNRGGRFGVWSIRPDGSELRPLTALRQAIYQPVMSPDGRWLVCMTESTRASLIDLTKPLAQRTPEPLPPPGQGKPFFANSWSPDRQRLAGTPGESGILLYSPVSRRYERLTEHGFGPVWMRDSRRLLYIDDGGGIFMADSLTRESREVLAAASGSRFRSLDLSPDGRVLYLVRQADEGDIWMLTLRGETAR
jgi:Tol biopolymer transport system component